MCFCHLESSVAVTVVDTPHSVVLLVFWLIAMPELAQVKYHESNVSLMASSSLHMINAHTRFSIVIIGKRPKAMQHYLIDMQWSKVCIVSKRTQ